MYDDGKKWHWGSPPPGSQHVLVLPVFKGICSRCGDIVPRSQQSGDWGWMILKLKASLGYIEGLCQWGGLEGWEEGEKRMYLRAFKKQIHGMRDSATSTIIIQKLHIDI